MKKIIVLLAVAISLNASAQKTLEKPSSMLSKDPGHAQTVVNRPVDTVPRPAADTVYVFSSAEVAQLKALLFESRLISSGQPLSGKELQSLLSWIDQRVRVFRKN